MSILKVLWGSIVTANWFVWLEYVPYDLAFQHWYYAVIRIFSILISVMGSFSILVYFIHEIKTHWHENI